MSRIVLVPTRRNKDRKAKLVTGIRIGVTDDYWVIRPDGEDRNLVLKFREWAIAP